MTLPFENDTNPIVKKISKRNLKADKSRNVLIIITIALATCLIMATALYFLGSQRKSLNDAMGRYQAVINDIDNDKIEKLVNDDRVDVGVILADEPTGNLDYQTGQEIMKLICASRELYRQTIVMVTHDMDSANYADRIVYMEDGALR